MHFLSDIFSGFSENAKEFVKNTFRPILDLLKKLFNITNDTNAFLMFLGLCLLITLILVLVIIFHLDVAGVAIATITAQGISAILVIICLMKTSGFCHLNIKEMKLYSEEVKDIIRIGLPAGFQSMLFSTTEKQIYRKNQSFIFLLLSRVLKIKEILNGLQP
mgnify:CR=1 FL=1